MIEIFLLEQFVTFAKSKTLIKAAEELHISQPALSRSMKKIEEELGVSLFERTKSKIALNETGKIAAKYAEKVLEANQEMIEKTIAFERCQRMIAYGSCAFLPANELMPLLLTLFQEKAVTSEIVSEEKLIQGLKNHVYQLVILHQPLQEHQIYCHPMMEEQLAITLPENHPLASKKTLTFHDLDGLSILAHKGSGFWIERCEANLKESKLLIQDTMDSLSELVNASSLPVFNSNRAMRPSDNSSGRITIPIADEAAHVTYYLACLGTEKDKYKTLFKSLPINN